MKKLFAIVILLTALMASNAADAKFSDEYRAKYPKRVKVATSQLPSGKMYSTVTYTLFKHKIAAEKQLQLVVRVSDDIVKICSISFGDFSDNPIRYTCFSWGDGKKKHELKTLLSFSERQRWRRYNNFITAQITGADLEEMKKAVIFSVGGGRAYSTPLLTTSHKSWKEWQEAVDAAAKIMNERYKRPT